MAVMSYIDAITLAMKEEMERDGRVFFSEKMLGVKAVFLKRQRSLRTIWGIPCA